MIHHGDCLEVLRGMPENSVDSIVTDPPYGFAFMGKKWDYSLPSIEIWQECLRVLKPGGYLLAFGGPRTYHRMACGVEDAGFEIRDQLQWLFGSGFPKSLDISKAIDKAAGAKREVVGPYLAPDGNPRDLDVSIQGGAFSAGKETARAEKFVTAPATPEAKQWSGFGTALKPANEPILLARKPLSEKTVAANVLKWGTGGINVDGCRVAGQAPSVPQPIGGTGEIYGFKNGEGRNGEMYVTPALGRFPANLILDETAAAMLDEQSGVSKSTGGKNGGKLGASIYGKFENKTLGTNAGGLGDTGGASRFFYVAKASKREKGEGCTHPTVKPITLMRYLCRLITPPNGVVLDPFMGSGSTGIAAQREGFQFIGIEREAEYIAIAKARLDQNREVLHTLS